MLFCKKEYGYISLTLLLLFFIGKQPAAYAQKYYLKIESSSQESKIIRKYHFDKKHNDSLSAIRALEILINKLHRTSYFKANVKAVSFLADTLVAPIEVGNSYKWLYLSKGNLPSYVDNKVIYKSKHFADTKFDHRELDVLFEQIIIQAENNGYPFAQIKLDSIRIDSERVSASLQFTPGPVIGFDTLYVIGDAKINTRFLMKYLQIEKGNLYEQKIIDQIDSRLEQLAFIKIEKPSRVKFENHKAIIYIYASKKSANQIDGFLGVMPNEEEERKVLLTGKLNLSLNNLFNSGKKIGLQFERIKTSNEALTVQYFHPLFFKRINFGLDFNLLRQDSSFLNINRSVLVNQNVSKRSEISFQLGLKTSRIAHDPQEENITVANFDMVYYALHYQWRNIHTRGRWPDKGWKVDIKAHLGNKTLKLARSTLEEEKLKEKNIQIQLEGQIVKYTPLLKRMRLQSALSGGNIINEQLFLNDLFRLGGINNIRGHNQNNFYTSSYILGTIEWQYQLDAGSQFYLFYDHALTWLEILSRKEKNNIQGLGLGIEFVTKNGIFNFIYALGGDQTQNISLNRSKIHFGYVNNF